MSCSVFVARASAPACDLCTGTGAGRCDLAPSVIRLPQRRGWRAPWRGSPTLLFAARTLRGLVIAAPVVWLAGQVGGDYVGATDALSLLFPFLAGLACGAALGRGASPERGWHIPLLSAGLGALCAVLGFESAGQPYGPTGRWLPPLFFGALGALLWWVYDRPVSAKKKRAD